jgi:hypothetical protein
VKSEEQNMKKYDRVWMFADEFLAASISLLSLSSFDAVDSFSTKEHSRLRLLDYVESHPLRDSGRKTPPLSTPRAWPDGVIIPSSSSRLTLVTVVPAMSSSIIGNIAVPSLSRFGPPPSEATTSRPAEAIALKHFKHPDATAAAVEAQEDPAYSAVTEAVGRDPLELRGKILDDDQMNEIRQ